jgi:hypothetical protein
MARAREWSTMAEFAPYDKLYSSRFYLTLKEHANDINDSG